MAHLVTQETSALGQTRRTQMTLSGRMAVLEQRLFDHEARCEERLAEIKATAASTLRAVEALKNRTWGVMVALLAWALAQLWSANAARLDHLETQRPESAREIADAQRRGGMTLPAAKVLDNRNALRLLVN